MATTTLFLFGEDTYRSVQKLAALKSRYIDKSLGDTNLATLDGASLTYDSWLRQSHAAPFLAPSRLVIVTNLLLTGKKDIQDRMLDSLSSIPTTTVVVFFEAGLPDQRTKFFKYLNKPKIAERFMPLAGIQRRRWVETVLADTPIEGSLLDWLAEQPVDLWQLASSIEQLRLYASRLKRPLAITDGQLFLSAPQSADVFQLIEAVARGDSRRALAEMQALLAAGQAELYLLAMIAYQYRTLISLAEARVKQSPATLARALKLSPYVVQKGLLIVGRRPPEDFIAGSALILAYDYQIKTGLVEPRIGLELLIIELAGQAVSG